MSYLTVEYKTTGEGFYDITNQIRALLSGENRSGILHLFVTHTSCALAISEAYDPKAINDVTNFMKRLAPRDLPYITHRDEGEDDSPSHMKSVLLHQNISLIVEQGQLVLGTWQGIYIGEFRDLPHNRKILAKFVPDA